VIPATASRLDLPAPYASIRIFPERDRLSALSGGISLGCSSSVFEPLGQAGAATRSPPSPWWAPWSAAMLSSPWVLRAMVETPHHWLKAWHRATGLEAVAALIPDEKVNELLRPWALRNERKIGPGHWSASPRGGWPRPCSTAKFS